MGLPQEDRATLIADLRLEEMPAEVRTSLASQLSHLTQE